MTQPGCPVMLIRCQSNAEKNNQGNKSFLQGCWRRGEVAERRVLNQDAEKTSRSSRQQYISCQCQIKPDKWACKLCKLKPSDLKGRNPYLKIPVDCNSEGQVSSMCSVYSTFIMVTIWWTPVLGLDLIDGSMCCTSRAGTGSELGRPTTSWD